MPNDALINSYTAHRSSTIVCLVVDFLRASGFQATLELGSKYRFNISDGDVSIILDLANAITEIATRDGEFDEQLFNPVYEVVKITTILNTRLKTVEALFKSERINELQKLTDNISNLTVRIYE